MINRAKKSKYKIKLPLKKRFVSLTELKQKVEDEVDSIEKDEIGYIEPGHGKKGKKKGVEDDQDLQEMYTRFKNTSVVLWRCWSASPSVS